MVDVAVAPGRPSTGNSINKLALFDEWVMNLSNPFKAVEYRHHGSSIVTPDQISTVGNLISAQFIRTFLPEI